MAFRLTVVFPSPTLDDVHRIRNFGEALFVLFRDNGLAEISLDEVDRASDRFSIDVPHRHNVRRVEALIEDTMALHHLDRIGTVSHVDRTT